MTYDRPRPHRSHDFRGTEEGVRCDWCDVGIWHAAAAKFCPAVVDELRASALVALATGRQHRVELDGPLTDHEIAAVAADNYGRRTDDALVVKCYRVGYETEWGTTRRDLIDAHTGAYIGDDADGRGAGSEGSFLLDGVLVYVDSVHLDDEYAETKVNGLVSLHVVASERANA